MLICDVSDDNCTKVIGGAFGQPGEMDGSELKRFVAPEDFLSYEAWYEP
jgi:hypothetical protein